VVGALNGDVDNHADLKIEHNLRIAGPDPPLTPRSFRRRQKNRPRDRADPAGSLPPNGGYFEGSVAISKGVGGTGPTNFCWQSTAAARRCTSVSPRTRSSSPVEPWRLGRRHQSRYVRIDGETPRQSGQPGTVSIRCQGVCGVMQVRSVREYILP
jgi:hypothetical protein